MDAKKIIRNSIFYGATAICTMHCINQVIYQNSKKAKELSTETGQYYDSHFGHLFYSVCGKGSPLLLIHDLDVSSSSYEWRYIIDGLSKEHTVYAIDLLGCGHSDKSNLIYTNYLYVQLVTDFIKNIIKSKTDIIANGHSSAFTIMSCTNNSSLIGKVIILNPEGIISNRKVPQKYTKLIKYIFAAPVIGRFIYNIHTNKETIKKKFYQKYYYDLEKISTNTIMAYYESSQKHNTKGKYLYQSLLCGFMNYNISSNLQKIENKISIIIGNSDSNNLANAMQYQNFLPDIEIRKIEHTKYLPHMESPEEFITVVKDLL